jgi:hypothetical protein
VVVENRECRFVPHAAVATVGSVLDLVNSDPILHTVHLYGPTEANVALPLKGMKIPHTLDRPGLMIVKCDVHGWMHGYLVATESPYVAVTDNSGNFKLTDVPPGTYTVEVWQEKLGKHTQKVTVKAKEDAKVNFELAGK